MSSPIEIASYLLLLRGGGGVTKVGVIVNQMATEASAVSFDNDDGQTFLTPHNGNATIGSTKIISKYIIVWHLTPRWKIILMGSDPVKIISSPEIIFAWFDLCQKYMVFT